MMAESSVNALKAQEGCTGPTLLTTAPTRTKGALGSAAGDMTAGSKVEMIDSLTTGGHTGSNGDIARFIDGDNNMEVLCLELATFPAMLDEAAAKLSSLEQMHQEARRLLGAISGPNMHHGHEALEETPWVDPGEASLRQQLEDLARQFEATKAQHAQETASTLIQMQDLQESLSEKNSSLQQEITNRMALEADLSALQDEFHSLNLEKCSLQNSVEELTEQLEATNSIEASREKLDDLELTNDGLSGMAKIDAQLSFQLEERQNRICDLEREAEEKVIRIGELMRDSSEKNIRIAQLQEDSWAKDIIISQLQRESSEKDIIILQLQRDSRELRMDLHTAREEKDRLRFEAQEASIRALELEQALRVVDREYTRRSHQWHTAGHRLGGGGFGLVELAVRADGLRGVMKFPVGPIQNDVALHEARLLRKVRSPYVVTLYDFIVTQGLNIIVLELCEGGDVHQQLQQNQACQKWYGHVSLGLRFLHQNRVIHRDLKPQNLLLGPTQDLKLGDLGCSCEFGDPAACFYAGTVGYSSPEVDAMLDSAPAPIPAGPPSDIWSAGRVFQEVMQVSEPPRPTISTLADMLAPRPEQRPSAQDVLDCLTVHGCAGVR